MITTSQTEIILENGSLSYRKPLKAVSNGRSVMLLILDKPEYSALTLAVSSQQSRPIGTHYYGA